MPPLQDVFFFIPFLPTIPGCVALITFVIYSTLLSLHVDKVKAIWNNSSLVCRDCRLSTEPINTERQTSYKLQISSRTVHRGLHGTTEHHQVECITSDAVEFSTPPLASRQMMQPSGDLRDQAGFNSRLEIDTYLTT